MDDLLQAQKKHDAIAAFWPRKVSPYLTGLLVRTPITPNQLTIVWGVISALNSYTVYLAMTGHYFLIAAVPAVYVFCYVLDCCDGEIARYRGIANPIGGKLLDGISHRATEYSLLATFGLAAHTLTGSRFVLPISLFVLVGDAMYTYVYERRLTTLRHEAGFSGHVSRSTSDVYERGTPWRALSRRQKIGSVTGQIHYKSVYPVIALAYVSGEALLVGLVLLGLYKNWKWVRLMERTLATVRQASPQVSGAAEPQGSQVLARAESVAGGPSHRP